MAYLVFKSLHLIGVIAWFAGLFYIFRLFVYHVEKKDKSEVVETLKTMERRLYYYITWPAMLFTVVIGVILIFKNISLLQMGWFHAKLFFLLFLFGYHFYSGHILKAFAKGNYKLSSKQCRLMNEIPTIILLIIIPLAIMKPF